MNLIIYITFYQNIKKGASSIISQPKGSGLPVRKVMIRDLHPRVYANYPSHYKKWDEYT